MTVQAMCDRIKRLAREGVPPVPQTGRVPLPWTSRMPTDVPATKARHPAKARHPESCLWLAAAGVATEGNGPTPRLKL